MIFRIVAFALVFSGLCLCSSARADDAEDKAVAFVEKLGGRVARDEKTPGKPVTFVSLYFTNVSGAGLKELAVLKNLATLELSATKLTDAGLKELQQAFPKCNINK
jgi:internalin A